MLHYHNDIMRRLRSKAVCRSYERETMWDEQKEELKMMLDLNKTSESEKINQER